jgi:hypothetical protein
MTIYCVYLTTYLGNKLPPFYIGYTKSDNIKYRNYRGTVTSRKYKEMWKREIKENPQLFKTKILSEYNNKEEAQEKEKFLLKSLRVIKNEMYINMAITCHADNTGKKLINDGIKCWQIYKHEKIPEGCKYGMLETQRKAKFGIGKGIKKKFSEDGMRRRKISRSGKNSSSKKTEVREKIKNSIKQLWKQGTYNNRIRVEMNGENNPFYGKKHSKKTNENNRQKHLGKIVVMDSMGNKFSCTREEFNKRDDLVGVNKGRRLYNNGKINILIGKNDPVPEGFIKGAISK